MVSERRLPNAIRRIHGQGFVDYTITRRLPKILADIEAQIAASGKLATAQAMLRSLTTGSLIDTEIFACPTAYWEAYLHQLNGLTWNDLSFFDVEFLFYHGVNSIAGYFDRGVDVFQQTRQAALIEALPAVASGLVKISELTGIDLLHAVIRCALFANEADYSQLMTSRSDSQLWSDRILIDEANALIAGLQQITDQATAIHLIADNAGHELCWDLVMIDAMLELFPSLTVFIHVKPWPMFVSDALPMDIQATLDSFINSQSQSSEAMALVGTRLQNAIKYGRLQIQNEKDWGEPRHFDALDSNLATTLGNAIAVISKGDLNYRRFVRDRQWPLETPVTTATAGVPFLAFALRVLKSDAIVGVTPAIARQAKAVMEDWRTCGHFAVIQRV
ncbi:MAG: ARMT1-like domain-containing protein [Cyanobacteria bacterium P01_F01_bin.86]